MYSVALGDREGFRPFYYTSNEPGRSGHQLGHTRGETGKPFAPVAVEQKYATTVDALLKAGLLPEATVIKIDVDGNEPDVLAGMAGLLQAPGLRSVQVEMHPASDAAIGERLTAAGFALAERHYTAQGQAALDAGHAPLSIPHNAVFTRDA
jgi:methyltransferase FkbM-like protein